MWDTCETFLAGGQAIACAKQKKTGGFLVRSLWPVFGVYPIFLACLGIIGIYGTLIFRSFFFSLFLGD